MDCSPCYAFSATIHYSCIIELEVYQTYRLEKPWNLCLACQKLCVTLFLFLRSLELSISQRLHYRCLSVYSSI